MIVILVKKKKKKKHRVHYIILTMCHIAGFDRYRLEKKDFDALTSPDDLARNVRNDLSYDDPRIT